jgi:hypothetical protein
MSSFREEMEERPLEKKEPKGFTHLCGICNKKVQASKFQSHWAQCFLRNEKNKAKVKGQNI